MEQRSRGHKYHVLTDGYEKAAPLLVTQENAREPKKEYRERLREPLMGAVRTFGARLSAHASHIKRGRYYDSGGKAREVRTILRGRDGKAN